MLGFLEAVYQEALALELATRLIPFEIQRPLTIDYKGQRLLKAYVADVVCFDQIIVELKALDALTGNHEAQLINYLRATKSRVGLLINFGSRKRLEWKRFAN